MIVALRALGIGDLCVAVPALRALRRAHPGEELALAAPAWLAPLVDLLGGVDRHLDIPDLTPRPWRWPAPRLAVNLHGSGPQSHRLLRAARPGRLLAYAGAGGPADGPPWPADAHEGARWCGLLAAYGIAADAADLDLLRPGPSGLAPGFTVLHPGAKDPARRWPADRFAALAARLRRAGHRVVVTGGAADRPAAARIAAGAGLGPAAVWAGRTDVGGLARLVADAGLVVSGDTGVAHLATGFGTPSVVLFAKVSPAHWGPPADRPQHRVLWHADLAARPAPPAGPHPALAAVDVDEVWAAVTAAPRVPRPARAAAAGRRAGLAGRHRVLRLHGPG